MVCMVIVSGLMSVLSLIGRVLGNGMILCVGICM